MSVFGSVKIKDVDGVVIDPVTAELIATINELLARLETLTSCKNALTESMRVHVVGNVSQAVTGTISNTEVTPTGPNMIPTLARFINHMAVGNTVVEIANINNVTA